MSKQTANGADAKQRSDDVNTNEEKDFSLLHLDERILVGLSKAGYKIPSQIQLEAIPLCLSGSDVFVQGKSGTGKTLAMSILALTAVLEAEDLQVLILAPTHEEAFQIHAIINAIGSEIKDLYCECFIGGLSFSDDVFRAEKCNIAVGTPGRICHLINEEKLNIDTICLFIIDNVDELQHRYMMFEISDIFDALPVKKQTVVTGLSHTEEVLQLASRYLKPSYLTCYCDKKLLLLSSMAHYYYLVPIDFLPFLVYRHKLKVLKDVLLQVDFTQCIIFCKSLFRVELLFDDIKNCGLSVVSLTKAMDQVQQLQALKLLKGKKCKVFISTNMRSRTLDSDHVDLVVNFDVPLDSRNYLHHCGRTGRNGAKISTITFLTKSQKALFAELENEEEFESYELPEPIPKDLISSINPVEVTRRPYNEVSSVLNSKGSIMQKGNQKKSKAGESGSLLTDIKAEEVDLFTASNTVPKSAYNVKTTSKSSHKALDEMHLKKKENGCRKSKKLPQVSSKKKYYYERFEDKCNRKLSSMANSGPFTTKPPSGTDHFKFVNQSCISFCSGSPAYHLDKKRVCIKCEMQSNCRKCLHGYTKPSQSYLNVGENSFPVVNNSVHRHFSCCNSKPCCRSYQHCLFQNCYCHHPFVMHRDMSYK